VRELVKQPLTEAEVRALGERLGGLRELIAPKRRKELEALGLGDEALVRYLSENPNHVRRPLVDTGRKLTAGFTADVRAALEAEWGG
jgi:arsenate reductase-like glutaredoxin family protein